MYGHGHNMIENEKKVGLSAYVSILVKLWEIVMYIHGIELPGVAYCVVIYDPHLRAFETLEDQLHVVSYYMYGL